LINALKLIAAGERYLSPVLASQLIGNGGSAFAVCLPAAPEHGDSDP
jgi:hypothetical protein